MIKTPMKHSLASQTMQVATGMCGQCFHKFAGWQDGNKESNYFIETSPSPPPFFFFFLVIWWEICVISASTTRGQQDCVGNAFTKLHGDKMGISTAVISSKHVPPPPPIAPLPPPFLKNFFVIVCEISVISVSTSRMYHDDISLFLL